MPIGFTAGVGTQTVGDLGGAKIVHGDHGVHIKMSQVIVDVAESGISLAIVQCEKSYVYVMVLQRLGVFHVPAHHGEGLAFFHARP